MSLVSESSSVNNKGILAEGTLINVLGRGLSLPFAVAVIPCVINWLGTGCFGVLTIVWIVIGYFGHSCCFRMSDSFNLDPIIKRKIRFLKIKICFDRLKTVTNRC